MSRSLPLPVAKLLNRGFKALGVRSHTITFMTVTSQPSGEVLSRAQLRPAAVEHPVNGVAYIGSFIERLFRSKAWMVAISFLSIPDERGIALYRVEGQLTVSQNFMQAEAERERRSREFFAAREFVALLDYEPQEGMRALRWIVDGNPDEITELCRTILEELYEIAEADGLTIGYDEHRERKQG